MAEAARQGKRKLEEEEEEEEKGENVLTNKQDINEEEEEYDSDDEVMYADGRRMSIRLRNKYYRQVKESEGFDITLDLELDAPIGAPVIPNRRHLNDSTFVGLSLIAIDTYNSQNGTKYVFDKNVTVNTSFASGMWCYITFEATDATSTTADTKTFQALAWWGLDGAREVDFCRLKKSSQYQGDKRPSNLDVDVKSKQ